MSARGGVVKPDGARSLNNNWMVVEGDGMQTAWGTGVSRGVEDPNS
jgi:hypothetical protein